jgi:hypothetical protein
MLLSKVRAPVYINPELGANEGLDKMVDTIKSSMLSGGELLQARVREIESTLPDVITDFERCWATNKLNLVPGTELLDQVLKRFGLAYRKVRDARAIAAAMTESEVPTEVKQLVNELIP